MHIYALMDENPSVVVGSIAKSVVIQPFMLRICSNEQETLYTFIPTSDMMVIDILNYLVISS